MAEETDRFARRMARPWATAASEALVREGEAAADAYEMRGEAAAMAAPDETEWLAYLSRLWVSIVPDAAAMAQRWIAAGKAASSDPFVQAAVRWLRANGARSAEGITRNSRRIIGEQIRIGLDKGENTEQIAARIRKHYKSVNLSRARTIARTEVHAATNYGTLAAAIETGERAMLKVWTTMRDSRVRETHEDIDGQSRSLVAPFDMDGEKLMFPGDTSYGAPGALTIGCRCVLWYERQRRRRPRAA